MVEVKSELYGALFVAGVFLVVGFLTYKTPATTGKSADGGRASFLLKGGILSFGITYLVLYFIANTTTKEVMENVIVSQPDF